MKLTWVKLAERFLFKCQCCKFQSVPLWTWCWCCCHSIVSFKCVYIWVHKVLPTDFTVYQKKEEKRSFSDMWLTKVFILMQIFCTTLFSPTCKTRQKQWSQSSCTCSHFKRVVLRKVVNDLQGFIVQLQICGRSRHSTLWVTDQEQNFTQSRETYQRECLCPLVGGCTWWWLLLLCWTPCRWPPQCHSALLQAKKRTK